MSLFERLAADVPFTISELNRLLRTAPHRYKVYTIPKRSSADRRVIAQPSAEVKLLQRWVVENVLSDYPIHSAAIAYRKGIGIKTNAWAHASQRFLLKLDFKDFFPSIRAGDFIRHTNRYAPQFTEDLPWLVNVLFRKTRAEGLVLSIGAPSSPAVSNSIAFDFDTAICAYVDAHDVIYTRYADDLIFSTNAEDRLAVVFKTVPEFLRTISYPTLTVNADKTVFTSRKWNRTVTGLVLTNEGGVSIGYQKKRLLRSKLHHYVRGLLTEEETAELKGYLAFVKDVEPELFEKLQSKVPDHVRVRLFDKR